MMTRLNIGGVSLLLGAMLLSGCGDKTEMPAVEESTTEEVAPQVETSVSVVEDGAITAAIVVEKSTAEAETAFIATTEVQTLTAKVVSINLETREVVLVGEDGVEMELIANEDTNNLDQVSPGDTVNAKFMERVTMELVKGGDLRAQEITAEREVQSEDGEMPVRAEVQKTITVYTVEAIDLEANTFKLKNVAGEVAEFTAGDPANLAKASVGDALVVTTTEAMAVEVVKAVADEAM